MIKLNSRYRVCLYAVLLFLMASFSSYRASANVYYWVGGSGDVSQVGHWSQTSGNSGNAFWGVIPGVNDDLIFDANSGFTASNKTVTSTAGLTGKSMNWTGATNNPTFYANGVNVTISNGNVTYIPNMSFVVGDFTVNGTVAFATGMSFQSSSNFSLYGSLDLKTGMSYSVAGTTTLNSTNTSTSTMPTYTITTLGMYLNTSLSLQGLANYSQVDALSTYRFTVSGSGTYNTNNNNLTSSAEINFGSASSVTLGTSTLTGGNFFTSTVTTLSALNATLIINGLIARSGQAFGNISPTDYINVDANGVTINNLTVPGYTSFQSGNTTVNTAVLSKSATFTGNNTFGSLSLGTGNYIFSGNTTQTVTTSFTSASATCTVTSKFYSGDAGIQATLALPAGSSFSNVIMQDIKATGATPFVANGSLDLGDNTGFAFVAGTIKTLYWIGGTGNYNDPTHWSNTSGGATANCVPNAYTDVNFDGGSSFTTGSKTVTLDVASSYARNMTWAGSGIAPTLNPNNQTLNLYGSLILQTGMTMSSTIGTLNFLSFGTSGSPASLSITTNGVVIPANNTYIGGYATWTLGSDYTANGGSGYVNFDYGTFNTNNYNFTVPQFQTIASTAAKPATLNLGSSLINITGGSFSNNSSYLTLNATAATIRFTNSNGTLTTLAGATYFNIEFNGVTGQITGGGGNTINKITFTSNAQFNTSNTIGQLVLAQGSSNSFTAGTTQTITSAFTGLVACGSPTIIAGGNGTSGSYAAFNISSSVNGTGVAELGSAIVSGIKNSGSGTLQATAGTNAGNNSNINFPASSNTVRYWVGGTGNWSDVTHWSYSSGGASGACVPTPNDDVFFDNNSFSAAGQIVTQNGASGGYCHNITWSGIASNKLPIFAPNTMYVYGSLQFMTGMQISGTSNTNYRSLNTNTSVASYPVQTINTNGVLLSGGDDFSGYATWNLLNDYTQNNTSSVFQISYGNFNTNNYTLSVPSFQAGSPVTFNAGTSLIYVFNNRFLGNNSSTVYNLTNASISSNNVYLYSGLTVANITINSGGVLDLQGSTVSNKTYFTSNANITSSGTTKKLQFTAGTTNTLTGGITFNVTDSLYISGNPCNPITIQSSSSTQATLNYTGGKKGIGYAIISGINVTPSGSTGTLQADNNSTDAGNNTNITFAGGGSAIIGLGPATLGIPCSSYPYTQTTDLFYADPAATYKWYNYTTNPTSTAVIATTANYVVNTVGTYGVSVTYGGGGVPCTVNDQIVLSISTNALNPALIASGVSKTATTSTCVDNGYIQFRDATDQTIKYAAINPNGNTGYNFTVTALNNSPAINNQMKTDGTRNTTALGNRMYTIADAGTNSYTVNGGMKVRIYYAPADFTAATSALDPSVTSSTATYWFKTPAAPSAILAGQTASGVPSATYISPSSTGTEGGISYVEFSNIQNFSTFGELASKSQVLPVTLTSFTGTANACRAQLQWTSATEVNSSYYAVEAGTDGATFTTMGKVTSKNLATGSNYDFSYDGLTSNKTFFRLRMVDKDGTSTYSQIVALSGNCQIAKLSIFPNPVKGLVTIDGIAPDVSVLEIRDNIGRVINRVTSNGLKTQSINLGGLSSGVYFVYLLSNSNTTVSTGRIIKL